MDDRFTFFYPVAHLNQPDFEGHIHQVEVLGEGHIVYQGRLICKGIREKLKKDFKAAKEKNTKQRVTGVKMCEECTKGYKALPDSAYYKFVVGLPKETIGKEVIPEMRK